MKGVAGMRTWMGSLVFNLVLASNGFSVQELPPEVAEHGYPDLVVVNGEIVSMDDASTRPEPGKIFEALAVKKDRIVALGSNEQIKALVGPKTRFIDVKGRTVIPGLVEPHAHLYGYALERLGEEMGLQIPTRGKRISIKVKPEDSLSSVKETILSRVRQETDSLKPGDWLVANASGHPLLTPWGRTKQLPVRAALDQVAPKNPVLLTAGPRGFINSKALEEASKAMPGYTQYMNASMGPEAEELGWVGVPEMGALTWEMWLAEKPLSLLAELFRREGQAWTSYGVTTFATRIPLPRVLSGYDLLHRKGGMPIRMAAFFETHRMPFFPEVIRTTYRRTGTFWNFGDDRLWFSGVSSELWDVEQSEACLGPDVDAPPEIKRYQRCPSPDGLVWNVLKEAVKAGWRVAGVHGVGSHGVRLFTQMLEEAMKEANLTVEEIRELRPTLEHGSVVGTLPDVVAKLKQYNIILSLGPRFFRDAPLHFRDYGPNIKPFILPYKSLIDAGVRVVGQIDNAEPHTLGMFYFIWLVTSRQLGDTVIPPEEERVDRVTALKMWTRWAAEYVYKEDALGSLELGKFADFVVLDRDYFTIPQAQIPKVRPLMTVLGGDVVFLHREFAHELGTGPVGFQPPPNWPQQAEERILSVSWK